MIGKIRDLRNHAAAAAAGSGNSQPTCGCPLTKHDGARGPITASISPPASMPEIVAPAGASSTRTSGGRVTAIFSIRPACS